MKSVQIPYDLFIDLAMYHLRGEDDFEEEIRQGLEKKLGNRIQYRVGRLLIRLVLRPFKAPYLRVGIFFQI